MKFFIKGDILKHDMGRLYTYIGRSDMSEEECILRTKDGVLRIRHESYLTKVESVTNKVMLSRLDKEY